MKIIGITGGVGAGKTQILEYLNNKYGATICMADEVGKKLQKKGTECFDEIVAHFGEKILDEKQIKRCMPDSPYYAAVLRANGLPKRFGMEKIQERDADIPDLCMEYQQTGL